MSNEKWLSVFIEVRRRGTYFMSPGPSSAGLLLQALVAGPTLPCLLDALEARIPPIWVVVVTRLLKPLP